MKKAISILLSLALLLTLGGCASASAAAAPQTVPPTEAAAPTETAPAETAGPTEAPEPKKFLSVLTTETFLAGIEQSTTYELFYDELGFLKESIAYLNGEESSRSSFQCDEKGNPLVETCVSADGVTTITTSQLTYDEAGELTAKTDTVTQNGAVTDVREYQYHGAGKLAQAKFYRNGETEPYSVQTSEFDDQGNETAVTFESGGTASRTVTDYDSQGRKLRSVQTDPDGNVRVISKFTYEEDGKVLQTNTDSNGTVLQNIVHLTYEEGDTKIQEVYVDDVLSSRVSSTYKPLEG